jgi:hypothetical protein
MTWINFTAETVAYQLILRPALKTWLSMPVPTSPS